MVYSSQLPQLIYVYIYGGLFCFVVWGIFYFWFVDFLPSTLPSWFSAPVSEPQPTGQNLYTPSLNQNISQVSSSQMEENR